MKAYKIVTEKFEGPLDLLLHLINKEQIDIYDIPISSVTSQYLDYISQLQEFDIELASEFLVMATILLQIKSRMLLPKQLTATEEALTEEEEDPRQQLIERLAVYKQFKQAGEIFAKLWAENFFYVTRQPVVFENTTSPLQKLEIGRLLAAIANLVEVEQQEASYIPEDEFYVKDKITDIIELLKKSASRLSLQETLVRVGSANELVVSFLAVLELMRRGQIFAAQPEKFGAIYLYLREDDDVLQ